MGNATGKSLTLFASFKHTVKKDRSAYIVAVADIKK